MQRCAPRSTTIHSNMPPYATHATCAHLPLSSSLQLRDLEISQRYEDSCTESAFRDSLSRSLSQAIIEPPDLPMPTCFRSRSHSYLRAIQAGCSQDDDTASVDSDSPPPTATTVRTYSTSTGEYQTYTKWRRSQHTWCLKSESRTC